MNLQESLTRLGSSAASLTGQSQYVSRLNSRENKNRHLFAVPEAGDENPFFDDKTGVVSPEQTRDMITALSNAQTHSSPPPLIDLIGEIAKLKDHAANIPELEKRATKIAADLGRIQARKRLWTSLDHIARDYMGQLSQAITDGADGFATAKLAKAYKEGDKVVLTA